MEKIQSFQITGMTIAGFKSYGEPTNLVFGNPTVITGGNGRGKTSIADAIAFAVTGLPFFGERGIDRLHNEAQPDVSITMNFVDEAGTAHVLTRTRHKSTMSILYDGYTIRQMDLTELFGEKDVFLSIFNPLYFIEELGEDGKNLLERHLPLISHEAVLAQLSDATRASLENEPLLSPDTYLKQKRADIRELEETIIYLQGQKDLTETQGEDWSQIVEGLSARKDAFTRTLEKLEAKRFDGLDTKAMEQRLVELSARYHEAAQDDSPLDAEILELERKLAAKLWKLARDFGVPVPEGIEIDIYLPITLLADMLGAPRETTSRICGMLTEAGLITIRKKRIIVTAPDRMAHFYKTGDMS